MYLLAGVAATRIRVGGNPRNGSDSGNGDSDDDGGKAGGASFFRDFAEGWSWSLHRRMLVLTMVSSALANFGVNGFQYAIQLHLMRRTDQRYRTGRAGDMLRIRVHLHRFAADAADRQLLGAAYRQRRDVPAVPDHQRVAARVHFR